MRGAALVVVLSLVFAAPAAANTYTGDVSGDPSPRGCNPGSCSLREAVIAANANPGPDTIVIPAMTITLAIGGRGEDAAATGDLDLTDDVTISGAGAGSTIIDGGGLDRVFDVRAGTASISGVTIRNGLTAMPPSTDADG